MEKDEEFRKLQERLGLSNAELAERLDVNPRTITRWRWGEVKPPAVVIRLMELWIKEKEKQP